MRRSGHRMGEQPAAPVCRVPDPPFRSDQPRGQGGPKAIGQEPSFSAPILLKPPPQGEKRPPFIDSSTASEYVNFIDPGISLQQPPGPRTRNRLDSTAGEGGSQGGEKGGRHGRITDPGRRENHLWQGFFHRRYTHLFLQKRPKKRGEADIPRPADGNMPPHAINSLKGPSTIHPSRQRTQRVSYPDEQS